MTIMRLDRLLQAHGKFSPNKLALRFGEHDFNYKELCGYVDRAASYLTHELGMKQGERVAFYGHNRPEHIILFFACAKLGLIFVPLNWRLAVPELKNIISDCTPKVLFFDENFTAQSGVICNDDLGCKQVSLDAKGTEECCFDFGEPTLFEQENVDEQVADDAPILIVYTSGTTGQAKGAVLSQKSVLTNAYMSQHAYNMTTDDVVLNFLPLFHVGGMTIHMLPALLTGASVVLMARFDADLSLQLIEKDKATIINCVPTILQALLASDFWQNETLETLRIISIGSTDVPVELLNKVQVFGIPVIQIYGATETGPIAIYQKSEDAFSSVGSLGQAGLYCDIRLVNFLGKDAEVNQNGEIWVRGESVFLKYWNDSEATAATKSDDWFKTGDVARCDENGRYWFADRIKNVIISGGENIYPAELERVLQRIPSLSEACVVGVSHEKWGEVPVAVCCSNNSKVGLSEAEILECFTENLARYKCPRKVIFVDALPRNAMGKIMVPKVKEMINVE